MNTVILHHNFSWESISIADCTQYTKAKDGYCNDETNIPECNYDGGDCCGSCINTDYCTNCTCIGNVIGNGVPNALVGDGFCNDETNNANCSYDHGDCCLSNMNTDYCSNCTCYLQETCVAGFHPLVGDGFCNDETNNAGCYYDGLDCCRSPVNTELCSNCTCHGELKAFLFIFVSCLCSEDFRLWQWQTYNLNAHLEILHATLYLNLLKSYV